MNVNLLRKVQSYILEHPKNFSMSSWVNSATPTGVCTTCIGGTACLLSGASLENPTSLVFGGDSARWHLGLTLLQGQQLFYTLNPYNENESWLALGEEARKISIEYGQTQAWEYELRSMLAARIIDIFIEKYATNVDSVPMGEPEEELQEEPDMAYAF